MGDNEQNTRDGLALQLRRLSLFLEHLEAGELGLAYIATDNAQHFAALIKVTVRCLGGEIPRAEADAIANRMIWDPDPLEWEKTKTHATA